MAIIYSYPHATPTINDMVLGARFRESEGISTNSFYISDLATIISEDIGIPTLQNVTEEGANTTIQMQINGVDVATVNDITGTPTLQEVVSEGNTVSGGTIKVELGSYYTSLEGVSANVSSSSNLLSLYAGSVLFEKQFGTGSVELKFPNTINDTRVIEFPNASGTIALASDITTKVLKTTITSAQVLQLFTTPITILNSDNPLTIAYPINVYIKRNAGDAYTLVANSFSVINDFGTTMTGNLNPNPLSNTSIGYFQSAITVSQNLSGGDKNVLYKLKASSGNPTLGTGDLDVYVTYIEITL